MFISFITAAANDVCKEKKRATINADDVFQALDDLEFGDLVPALQEAFEGGSRVQIGEQRRQLVMQGPSRAALVKPAADSL